MKEQPNNRRGSTTLKNGHRGTASRPAAPQPRSPPQERLPRNGIAPRSPPARPSPVPKRALRQPTVTGVRFNKVNKDSMTSGTSRPSSGVSPTRMRQMSRVQTRDPAKRQLMRMFALVDECPDAIAAEFNQPGGLVWKRWFWCVHCTTRLRERAPARSVPLPAQRPRIHSRLPCLGRPLPRPTALPCPVLTAVCARTCHLGPA